MKKVLFAVAALGLGLGLAATDASAVSFSASGKYVFEGRYVSNGADGSQPGAVNLASDTEANDFAYHLFYTYPTIKINDNTLFKGEVRFIDRDVYGTAQSGENAINKNQEIWVRRLWAEWKMPLGTLHVGRMPGGAWGSNFLDSSNGSDRIKLVGNFMPEPFSLVLIWQKSAEVDGFTGDTDEADTASWYVGVGHKADFGATTAAFWHTRSDEDASDFDNTHFWFNTSYKFGMFNLDSEWRYIFGDAASGNDISSLGTMINAYTNMDALTAGILFLYLQGDDDLTDDDDDGTVSQNGVGNDYNPFLIAMGDYTGLLNKDKNGYYADALQVSGGPLEGIEPGLIALGAWGRYALSDKVTLNGAFGQVWADETPSGVDDAIGFEIDLGMNYRVLDNLSYSLQAGYLWAGDMIEDLAGDSEDAFMIVHSMTMTF